MNNFYDLPAEERADFYDNVDYEGNFFDLNPEERANLRDSYMDRMGPYMD